MANAEGLKNRIESWWFYRHRNGGSELVSYNGQCDMHSHRSTIASLLQQSIIMPLQVKQCDTTTMFVQDGALPHIARYEKQLLRRHFGDGRIINQKFPTVFPSKYSDLNPCDFWLRGYFKTMVHRDPITSQSELKENVECHVPNIPQFLLLSTVEYAILRFRMAADNGGHHIEHIL